MISYDGVVIELQAADPGRLAEFYELLFGLSRESEAGPIVTLAGAGLTLRIRPAALDVEPEAGIAFGFRLPIGVDLEAARDALVAAGAVVLSESKRGAVATLACQDPAGNDFSIVSAAAGSTDEPAPGALVSVARPPGAERTPPAVVPRGRPTRRDVDLLLDSARLASMQETVAGLHLPFTADDPATAIDEMRSKIGAPLSREMAEADAALRARERESAVAELLERYRREASPTTEAPEPAATSAIPPSEEAPEAPLARTLGRSRSADEPDGEPT